MYICRYSRTKALFNFYFGSHMAAWEKRGCVGGGGGMSTVWGRREQGVQGLFICAPHPLYTQSGLYCILQIYTQDVGLECFPGKKRKTEKRKGVFFVWFLSKCLLSWARVIEAHKQTFVSSLTDARPALWFTPHPERIVLLFRYFEAKTV